MLNPYQIRNFYLHGFEEAPEHERWLRIWNKHFRIKTLNGHFVKLNSFRERFNFKALQRHCIKYAPAHLYMSVLNWLMPERVGKKRKANHANPIGGEYVIDIDANTVWRPHSHLEVKGVCAGCLALAYDATLLFLDKIGDNHSDIHVVFSGRRGFHIHVLDFDVRDWTHYNERDPVKSHEVARYLYTRHLREAGYNQNHHHFVLSCDVTRVITFPESLNGETGLICKYLGGPKDFSRTSVSKIIWESDAPRYLYDLTLVRASELHAHPEPRMLGR